MSVRSNRSLIHAHTAGNCLRTRLSEADARSFRFESQLTKTAICAATVWFSVQIRNRADWLSLELPLKPVVVVRQITSRRGFQSLRLPLQPGGVPDFRSTWRGYSSVNQWRISSTVTGMNRLEVGCFA